MSDLFKDIKGTSNLITGHINPDGDALGSALAFKLILDSKGVDSDVSFDMKGNVPSNLNHLPIDLIIDKPKENYDSVYVFDCGNSERLGDLEGLALSSERVIVVDHHINPSFGDIQIIDSKAASTTQVLYREIISSNIDIDKNIANCLMTGLITDTGRFQYSNTDNEVFEIASKLMLCGAELTSISDNIYGSIPMNAIKLQSEVLNRIELHEEEELVVSYVLQEDYLKYNIESSETDFLIDSIRLVKESNIALLLKEQKDKSFKGSLRSRNELDVQQVASIFGGGGHKAASGFSTNLSMNEIKNKVKNAIKSQI
ncbi:MAG: bifunctional oligoribonuclease/PAP phosphatase NrnA [Candidatus Actinomarina sp.]|nr:bifunctional oligoribonuclease/PAP phosphatase NrnA [Candidatus Actinomarina sp.]MBL6762364.1 bifunctional oligoribonuclease/PAP phosphatase NrnA [Candidatus Actinomarina sp.]MBL6836079.1 bifunctional oligoribonuclease/PAP phosphatase NrnA [Candidatus Actinomarina sp.]